MHKKVNAPEGLGLARTGGMPYFGFLFRFDWFLY